MASNKAKRNRTIPILLALVCVSMALFILFVYRLAHSQRAYQLYMRELSSSTLYSYQHWGLQITGPDGETVTLYRDQAYIPYQLLYGSGQGVAQKEIPEDGGCISLDYGDGSRMRLWYVPAGAGGGIDNTLICFESQDGGQYTYQIRSTTLWSKLKNALRQGDEAA